MNMQEMPVGMLLMADWVVHRVADVRQILVHKAAAVYHKGGVTSLPINSGEHEPYVFFILFYPVLVLLIYLYLCTV